MTHPGPAKQEFLVVYDYGMGGLWAMVVARSKEEITSRYPILQVLDQRPEWMTEARFQETVRWRFDIDETPPAWVTAGSQPRS